MKCSKCGAELRIDALFCHKCGTAIKDMLKEDPDTGQEHSGTVSDIDDTDYDYDKYFITDTKIKEPGKRKYYVIGALAAVLVVFFICFTGTNTFKRMFYKPVDYYRYVEKKNALKHIEIMTGWYKACGIGTDDGGSIGSEGSLNIKLSEDVLTPASDALAAGDLSFLSDISLYGKTTVYDDLKSRNSTLSLGGKQILTLNTINDSGSDKLYLRIPELSDDYLAFDKGALKDIEELIANFVPYINYLKPKDDAVDSKLEEYESVLRALPDAVRMNRIMSRYTDLIFDNIDDVDRSGRETLEIGGIGQKCYILTVKPGYRDMMKLALAIRETVIDDEDVKEVIVKRAKQMGEDGEDAWDAFILSLDVLEDVAAACPDLLMKVYVDTHGNIICRELVFDDSTQFKLRYGRTINGREFGAQLYVSRNSLEDDIEFNIEGSGKKAGRNYSGDFTLSILNMDSIGLTLNSFDEKAFEEQKLNGQISVAVGDVTDALKINSPAIGFIKDYLGVLKVETPDEGTYDIELKMADGRSEPAACTYSYRRTGGSRISLPKDPVPVSQISDMKEYLKEADFDRIKNNLEAAGVPDGMTKYFDYIERAVDYIDYIDLIL